MIQYDASTDYNAANIIYNGLKNDYDNLELRGISYYSWSDSNFYNTFLDYEVVVVVGAQGANSLYAWLVSKGLIRNAIESDNGFALVQEASLTIYSKTFKIFTAASWNSQGTTQSAYAVQNKFCKDSDVGINYFTKGTVNYNYGIYTDYCGYWPYTDNVGEYYCFSYNSVGWTDKTCSNYDTKYCDGNYAKTKDYYCLDGRCAYTLTSEYCGDYYCDNWKESYCKFHNVWHSRNCHYRGCDGGICFHNINEEEALLEECMYQYHDDWQYYCKESQRVGGEVWRKRTWYYGDCEAGKCIKTTEIEDEGYMDCSYGCRNGACCDPECIYNSDCGINGYTGTPYCYSNDVWQNYRTYTCNSPATCDADCSYKDTSQKIEECPLGCSNGACIKCFNTRDSCCDDNDCTDYCSGDIRYYNGKCPSVGVACTYSTRNCNENDEIGPNRCVNNDIVRERTDYWCNSNTGKCNGKIYDELVDDCDSHDIYTDDPMCLEWFRDVYRWFKDYSCSSGDTSCSFLLSPVVVEQCAQYEWCIDNECKPYKGTDFVCSTDDSNVCHYYGGWSCPVGCSDYCYQNTDVKSGLASHNYAFCWEHRNQVAQYIEGDECSGCENGETWCSYCKNENTEATCRWDSDYYQQRWRERTKHCDYGCDQSKGICKDTSCHNGVRDYDEEGIDCGGVCGECETLSVLFVPYNWDGSHESYSEKIKEIADYFLERIPLSDCPKQFKFIKSQKDEDYGPNWDQWRCNHVWTNWIFDGDCFDGGLALRRIFDCAEEYKKAKDESYDFVVGITDNDVGVMVNPFSCEKSKEGWSDGEGNLPSVISQTNVHGIVTHELGHEFGLEDQYCNCDGTPSERFCGTNVQYSRLRTDLGCNPTLNMGCCWQINRQIYPGCNIACWGNMDMQWSDGIGNNRTTMSNLILIGETGHYDINEYDHLEEIPKLQCKDQTQIRTMALRQVQQQPNPNLGIMFSINTTDDVELITLNYSTLKSSKTESDANYSLKILDQNNNYLLEIDFSVPFIVFSDPPTIVNQSIIFKVFEYQESMRKIEVYHNKNLIFSHDMVALCNNNNMCDSNENYYSCSVDCDPWAKDGICRAVKDYNCDPDCIENADPDCFKLELQQGWNLVSYPVMLNISTEALLNPIDGKYGAIYTYNSSDPISKWKKFNLTETGSCYFNSINNKIGLWIYMNQNGTLEMSGLPSINTNFILKNGWNLISYPSLTELETNEVFNEVLSEIIVVYSFENNEWNSYSPLKNDLLNTLGKLKPGMGLWVNVRNDTIWVFDKGFKKY